MTDQLVKSETKEDLNGAINARSERHQACMKSCASQQQAQQNAMLDCESEAEAETDAGESLISPTPTEPEHLMCSLSYMMFREPMFVPESGKTYERSLLEAFWKKCGETKDPVTNVVIDSTKTFTNWTSGARFATSLTSSHSLRQKVGQIEPYPHRQTLRLNRD
jgi:hypothetical protein